MNLFSVFKNFNVVKFKLLRPFYPSLMKWHPVLLGVCDLVERQDLWHVTSQPFTFTLQASSPLPPQIEIHTFRRCQVRPQNPEIEDDYRSINIDRISHGSRVLDGTHWIMANALALVADGFKNANRSLYPPHFPTWFIYPFHFWTAAGVGHESRFSRAYNIWRCHGYLPCSEFPPGAQQCEKWLQCFVKCVFFYTIMAYYSAVGWCWVRHGEASCKINVKHKSISAERFWRFRAFYYDAADVALVRRSTVNSGNSQIVRMLKNSDFRPKKLELTH